MQLKKKLWNHQGDVREMVSDLWELNHSWWDWLVESIDSDHRIQYQLVKYLRTFQMKNHPLDRTTTLELYKNLKSLISKIKTWFRERNGGISLYQRCLLVNLIWFDFSTFLIIPSWVLFSPKIIKWTRKI